MVSLAVLGGSFESKRLLWSWEYWTTGCLLPGDGWANYEENCLNDSVIGCSWVCASRFSYIRMLRLIDFEAEP